MTKDDLLLKLDALRALFKEKGYEATLITNWVQGSVGCLVYLDKLVKGKKEWTPDKRNYAICRVGDVVGSTGNDVYDAFNRGEVDWNNVELAFNNNTMRRERRRTFEQWQKWDEARLKKPMTRQEYEQEVARLSVKNAAEPVSLPPSATLGLVDKAPLQLGSAT